VGQLLGFSSFYLELVGTRLLGVIVWPILLFAGARLANGYRGVHETFSGTRVVKRLRDSSRSRSEVVERPVRQAQVVKPKGIPSTLGPYTIEGAMLWDPRRKILLGHDPGLGRPVWIVLRDRSAADLPPARRELRRLSRQRWLIGGETIAHRWDALEATEGCLLADLIVAEGTRSGSVLVEGRRGLPWADARPILEQLAEELSAACRDGTLPHDLTPDHVWIPRHGHVQLLDTPMGGLDTTSRAASAAPAEDCDRALAFLREVAIVLLEGGRRPVGAPPKPIRAPVPVHARRMLDRLLGFADPYPSVDPFLQDMGEAREAMAELAPALRLVQAGLFVTEALGKMGLSIALLTLLAWLASMPLARLETWGFAALLLIGWPLWTAATRGGFGLRLLGMTVVRSDGAPASRARLAWREFCFWLPIALVVLVYAILEDQGVGKRWLAVTTVLALALIPVLYAVHGLLRAGRLLQDRLAGTQMVPE
jgi:hypothetical protein